MSTENDTILHSETDWSLACISGQGGHAMGD